MYQPLRNISKTLNMKTKQLLITLLFLIIITISGYAQDSVDKITVIGKASLKAVPENMIVTIPLMVQDSVFETCSDELIHKMTRIKNGLHDLGIKKESIKTDNLSIRDKYEFIDRKRVRVGYNGSVTIQMEEKYSPEMVSKIISLLKDYQMIYNLDFKLSEDQKQKLTDMAIKEAISDAKYKAQLIATASAIELKRISKIIYDYNEFGNDILLRRESKDIRISGESSLSTTLNPSELSIEKKIQMEWIIENK